MANHYVLCYYCGEKFAKEKTDHIKVNGRRYAHTECHEKAIKAQTQDEEDKESMERYILEILKTDSIDIRVRKQISTFMKEYQYTYSGIEKTLRYFYEIQGNPTNKANGGIGIVPYVYSQAFEYYRNIWKAQSANAGIDISSIAQRTKELREVRIVTPVFKPKGRRHSFLEEEEPHGKIC